MIETFSSGLSAGLNNGMQVGFQMNANERQEKAQKHQDEEWARQDADKKADDEIKKAVGEKLHSMLKVESAPVSPATVAAQGVGGLNSSASDATPSKPADGVLQPAKPTTAYREATIDDYAAIAKFKAGEYLTRGMSDKAMEAHKEHLIFANEKLQKEQVAREQSALSTIASIDRGEVTPTVLNGTYKFIPNGRKITSVEPEKDAKGNPTGALKITSADDDGKNPTTGTQTPDQLKQTIAMLGKSDFALKYLDTQFKMSMEGRKANTEEGKAAEDARHHKATEGIDRDKLRSNAEGATAEIKNVKFLLSQGIAKNSMEAWKMAKAGSTPSGERIISDGNGGVIVIGQDTGSISKIDRRGEQHSMRQGANAEQPTGAQPVIEHDTHGRFSTDPAMKGMQLGRATSQGVEVLDASGKLVGHYN